MSRLSLSEVMITVSWLELQVLDQLTQKGPDSAEGSRFSRQVTWTSADTFDKKFDIWLMMFKSLNLLKKSSLRENWSERTREETTGSITALYFWGNIFNITSNMSPQSVQLSEKSDRQWTHRYVGPHCSVKMFRVLNVFVFNRKQEDQRAESSDSHQSKHQTELWRHSEK